MRVVRHTANLTGRDFVIGDVHGTYSVVAAAMNAVGFDFGRDRLFSVGDLVDRGPESRRALAFMRNPAIFPICGNHEDMLMEPYQATDTPDEDALRFWTSRNGMAWFMGLSLDERLEFILAFRELPIVREIETARGTVGLVHGEVPGGMDWRTFVDAIEAGDKRTIKSALWRRSRIEHRDNQGVRGIGRVFCGHTIVGSPTQLGNVYYVDSGSFVGVRHDNPEAGRLTIADLMCCTQTFRNAPSGEFFDIRAEPAEPGQPFGAYAA